MTLRHHAALLALAAASALAACSHAATSRPAADPDAAFQALAAEFLERYLAVSPVQATQLGDHRHDGQWPAPWPRGEREERDLVAWAREALARIPAARLSPEHRVDARILANQLDAWTFSLDELREPERDPLYYTALVGDGLDPLLTRDFEPLDRRLASVAQRLAGLPAVLEAGRRALAHPPRLRTETALEQNKGLVELVERDVPALAAKVPAREGEVRAAAAVAGRALREFGTFLERDLLPRSDGDVRLGRERFARKFRLFLDTDVAPEELAAKARALLASTQDEMFDTAVALWPELYPGERVPAAATRGERLRVVRRALDGVARDHPTDATIVDEARALGERATAFVREHDLVTVPAEPLRVIPVPEYRRGIAVGYCDASGPLEARPETAVAISPTPPAWPASRVESFYREYNRAMLAEFMVHEAMPGHFLQLAHARAVRSPVRALFGSGPFVEGWAVYAEWLMAREGFGGARVRLEREKMILRAAANALLDQGVHAGGMDEASAMRLMTEEALQEEGEAVGKWRRAQLTSTQLSSYALGFVELMAIRDRAQRQPGFAERRYHDRLLSFGAPAPRDLPLLLWGEGR